MKFLELKIPPLLLMFLFAIAMWLLRDIGIVIDLPATTKTALALMFASAGMFISAAGVVAFRQAKTTVDPTTPEASSNLVSTGIYKFTRNPMYVGFACALIGIACYCANPAMLLYVAIFIAYLTVFQIKPEERMLSEIFGHAYTDYCGKVRRWL